MTKRYHTVRAEAERKIWRLSRLKHKISELHRSCCAICDGKTLPEYEIDITLLDELQAPIDKHLKILMNGLS